MPMNEKQMCWSVQDLSQTLLAANSYYVSQPTWKSKSLYES